MTREYRYIPALKHGGPGNFPPTRVVIHCTVSPCRSGGAVDTAKYFQSPNAGGSAHLVADPGRIVRCLPDQIIAYHAPPNTRSLGIELCDPMDGNAARWHDKDHTDMLRLAAVAVADWCRTYGIPIIKLGPTDLLAGDRGICGHTDVSQAWHRSTHWDPGPQFPWPMFLELVKQADAFAPSKGDDMTPEQSAQLARIEMRVTAVQRDLAAIAPVAVDAIYRRRLGRPADPQGLKYFCDQIDKGKSLAWVDTVLAQKAAAA